MTHKKSRKRTVATFLGYGLAHVQNIIDGLVDAGFHTLRKAGERPIKTKKNERRVISGTKKGLRFTLKFLGDAGESYFDTYGALKAKKQKGK
jgi:predicted transcriptional regulator